MDLKLDSDGNLAIESGDMVVITDKVESTRQRLIIKFKFFKAEWFLDERAGIPYFQDILVKPANLNAIKAIYAEVINEDEGVEELLELTVNFDGAIRKLSVAFTARVDGTDELLVFEDEFIIGD